MQRDRQRAGLCRLPQAGSVISRAASSARDYGESSASLATQNSPMSERKRTDVVGLS